MSALEELGQWYEAQCDEDWEHHFGVSIRTLDNPGWSVWVDLAGTHLENVPFDSVIAEESEREWMHCKTRDRRFEGYGGPTDLERIIRTFLDWAQEHEAV